MSLEKEFFRKEETTLGQAQEQVPDFLKSEEEEVADLEKDEVVIQEGGEMGKGEKEDEGGGEVKEKGEGKDEIDKKGGEEEEKRKGEEVNENAGGVGGGKEGVKRQISMKMKKTTKFSQADFLSRLEVGNLNDENDLDNQRFMAFDGFIGPISTSFNFSLQKYI